MSVLFKVKADTNIGTFLKDVMGSIEIFHAIIDDNPLVNYVDWEHYAREQMYNYTQIKTEQGIYLWGAWC